MPKKHYWVAWADCGDIFGHIDADDPVEACRLLDAEMYIVDPSAYSELSPDCPDRALYWVHEAPSADWRGHPNEYIDDEVAALPLVAKVVRRGAKLPPLNPEAAEMIAGVVAHLKREEERLKLLEAKKKKLH